MCAHARRTSFLQTPCARLVGRRSPSLIFPKDSLMPKGISENLGLPRLSD